MNPIFPHRLAVCLGAIFGILALPSCDGDRHTAEWWQGEQERIELSNRLELQRFRYEQLDSRDFTTYEKLRRANADAAITLKSLREQNLALADQVETLQTDWSGFRDAILHDQRQRALTAKFDTMKLSSGRTFEGVSVSAINDAGVTIRHATGSARLSFSELNNGQRVFFGLEQDLAVAAIAGEKRSALAYEQWIDDRLTVLEAKKAKASVVATRDQTAAREIRAKYNAQLMAASSNRALAQPARSVGSRYSTYYYNNYSNYNPYGTYYRYYNAVPSGCYVPLSSQAALQQLLNQSRINTGYCPSSVQPRPSFADTTIPSIP